jgi:nucleoid-associated protein YgaU
VEKRAVATIEALEGAFLGDPATVIFNPGEYSIEKSNQFGSTALPGMANPILSFVNGSADTLTMELFFDTYTNDGGSDVRVATDKIARLMAIDPELHAPPLTRFVWGGLHFRAVIERLTQRFTMFREDGVPVRATLNVSFKEYRTVSEQLGPKPLRSADWTKRRIIAEGDRLSLIAAAEYDDPAQWRKIAEANDIDDPRRLTPGREIRIPPLQERR